jgi:hypothetical protein
MTDDYRTPPAGDLPLQWPKRLEDLAIFLTSKQLAQLLTCSPRKLERHRNSGEGIPFVKHGRRVYYPRDVVFSELRKRLIEARRKQRERRGRSNMIRSVTNKLKRNNRQVAAWRLLSGYVYACAARTIRPAPQKCKAVRR